MLRAGLGLAVEFDVIVRSQLYTFTLDKLIISTLQTASHLTRIELLYQPGSGMR